MRLFQSILLGLSLGSLAILGACSNNSSNNTSSTPAATTNQPVETVATSVASASPDAAKSSTHDHQTNQGGQVIETGDYHLELVVAPEEKGVHLDFFLQKGDTHEAIPDAKVTAQLQLPDGTQKSLDLTYDAPAKHYAATLPSKTAGEYKIVVLSDIKGEKVNGRFNFKL